MSNVRVFITGIGIISPLGNGLSENINSIKSGKTGIGPLTLFQTPHSSPLPVGQTAITHDKEIPRTHALAFLAAEEAMKNKDRVPDAVIIGSTTGGMPVTENLIRESNYQSQYFRYHSTGSVAEYIAEKIKCAGTILTVSTACSSGALALKIALEYLKSGMGKCVLAGGADALCRLTYHGFNSLQLIDPEGARPLDINRKGMSVAEGAAMLYLSAALTPPENAIAEILGAGLSCDAYHPASPHPEGSGAAKAIREALVDSGITENEIDYINLHGTGTIDNDLSEARALHAIFGSRMPRLSSTKGAFGHSLAAAGAIEAVVSAICIREGIIPANSGCIDPDPQAGLKPVTAPMSASINNVLSNSFGFGGNNAAVVFGRADKSPERTTAEKAASFSVIGSACITGAGNLEKTIERISAGKNCRGILDAETVCGNIPKNKIRRLKRLPRMVLSLADSARNNSVGIPAPSSIYFGTGWGSLSETYDFLAKLFESDEQFPSPTDFIGSVHNAPAGQAAIWFGSTGTNVTATGGDYSFEQALLCLGLLNRSDEPVLLIGADEYHNVLSKVLDGSAALDDTPSDGGAAFIIQNAAGQKGPILSPAFLEFTSHNENIIKSLIKKLGGPERISELFGAVFLGIPASKKELADEQLSEFLGITKFSGPMIDYRRHIGQFASASASAAAIAVHFVKSGNIPAALAGRENNYLLNNSGILLLGFGDHVTAVEVLN